MNIKPKRVIALAMAVLMTAALALPVLSMKADAAGFRRFTDVTPDKWYYEAVNALAGAGILNGYEDGTFKPDNPMTAGELASVLWGMICGKWCKASELYNLGNNGCYWADFSEASYPGPRIDNWGIPVEGLNEGHNVFLPTTWDGPVTLLLYGDSHKDPTNSGNTFEATAEGGFGLMYSGREAGCAYKGEGVITRYYSRNMSGLAVVAMSKEYVTRGFAISELVNVLRETGGLKSIYNASASKKLYTSGAAIPDWSDITNVYHDACAASSPNDSTYFHDYVSAWNYIDDPGKIKIPGGYANTWFSRDILLAYQAGIIGGVDSTGRCSAGAPMTRAEVCQMLYNAGVSKTNLELKPRFGFPFVRDNKLYLVIPDQNTIEFFRTYRPDSDKNQRIRPKDGSSYYVYDPAEGIDIRRQEWPTHPEFWGT